tara:strand:- start:361 stop:762 length:402 start_codon:yes stop_codon:yes gene_type:complete
MNPQKVLIYTKKLSFLKDYWREVLIAFLFCLMWVKSKQDQRQIKEAYSVSVESLEEQIRGLQGLHKTELELRDEAIEKYQKDLDKLEKEYQKAVEDLEEEKNKNRDKYVENFSGDPDMLVEKIQDNYGFTYVP